ncbi:MAG: TIGR01212 family radical SAM protein [Muribaculaceae bacterium]|nr:TIGR01212 family radical SAM protein [Muribaculaceae bacterium]
MKSYAAFLAEHFEGKIQKIPVDTQHVCPNRDGTCGRGGCTYCLNGAFSPDAQKAGLSVHKQIARGRKFFAKKYSDMRYLAYFQSHTPTHAPISVVIAEVAEAISEADVAGVVISTRPDCLPNELLNWLTGLGKPVLMEIGGESSHDATLLRINRCHTWAMTTDAVQRCAAAGVPVGLHLIMGLPGEDEEMMLETIRRVNGLPVSTVKLHHLQILRGTALARDFEGGKCDDMVRFTPESYAALCRKILDILRDDIAVERFVASAPGDMLIAPRWGIKPGAFNKMIGI